MIKVTLLGDSIRQIGYGLKVPELLGDQFEVYTFSEAIQTTGFADHAAAMTALIGDDADLQAHATRLLKEVVGD